MDNMKAYPDGTVTFSKLRRFLPDPLPKRKPPTEAQQWAKSAIAVHGVEAALASAPLGLSILDNSRKPPKSRRGLGGMTSHQRRLTRWGAGWLEEKYGRQNLSFLTNTLPAEFTHVESHMTAAQWAECCRRFVEELRRQLRRKELPDHVIGCVEIQESRQERFGGVPYHLHIVFVGKKRGTTWGISKEWCSERWEDIVRNATGNKEEINFGTATRIEKIRKSASGYLGKYMSKGAHITEVITAQGLQAFLPTCWNIATQALRKLYKKLTRQRSGNDVKAVFDRVINNYICLFAFSRFVEIEGSDGLPKRVAWHGRLKGEVSVNAFWSLTA